MVIAMMMEVTKKNLSWTSLVRTALGEPDRVWTSFKKFFETMLIRCYHKQVLPLVKVEGIQNHWKMFQQKTKVDWISFWTHLYPQTGASGRRGTKRSSVVFQLVKNKSTWWYTLSENPTWQLPVEETTPKQLDFASIKSLPRYCLCRLYVLPCEKNCKKLQSEPSTESSTKGNWPHQAASVQAVYYCRAIWGGVW